MKIGLINPGNPARKILGGYNRAMEPFAPLGLAYLAAALGQAGHEVVVHDQFAEKIPTAVLVDRLHDERLDLIGASCLTPDAPDIAELRGALRARGVGAPFVLGNLHATLFHDKLLADGSCDYVVRGEGEQALVELHTWAGKQFDPELVAVFMECVDSFRQVERLYPDEEEHAA